MQLNRQVKDYTDISTVFTDFSKSFNIPATDGNNAIFQNFFDENVLLQSWNQNYALNSQIFVHGLPVFNGVVELLEVKFTNGLPSDYSIVFYGQGKKMLVGWGEMTLQEIDWSAYNHSISDAIAVSSWSGGLLAGKVVWDLKDYGYGVTYSTFNTTNNIAKANGISYLNLRPSILVKEMVQTIFAYQGYELSGTLLARPEFTNMYITPMNTAGPFIDLQGGTLFGNFSADNGGTPQAISISTNSLNTWQTLPIGNTVTSGNVSAAWNIANYEYIIPQNGNYTFTVNITSLTGAVIIQVKAIVSGKYSGSKLTMTGSGSQTVTLNNLQKGDVFKFIYQSTSSGTVNGNVSCTNSPATVLPTCVMSNAMPDTKVSDFFSSFLKTFNAVIVPTSYTSFELHNLEDWYRAGQNVEYTEFIDFKTLTHKKMPIPGTITMSHDKGETLPQIYFNDSYKREFGSVEFRPDIDFSEGDLKVETKFQINPPTIIRQTNQNGVVINNTDIQIPAIYDKDAKAVNQKLNLFYFNGMKPTNFQWYFGTTAYSNYPQSSSFSGTTSNSYSLAFGLEANYSGDLPKKSIYFQFWNEYISRLYSTRSRIVIVNAVLPVGVWLNMRLNDNIAISGNYYKIQKITYDLLSQKAVIELMTYPLVNILTISSTSGKNVTYDSIPATDGGKTFIDGNPIKKGIGNAIYDGSVFTNNALQTVQFNESLSFEFMALRDNYMPTLSLNKISIWRTTTLSFSFSPTPSGFALINSGTEGDSSYYTATLSSSQVTINSDGQYRFKSTIIINNSGGRHIGAGIYIDGMETEAYSELHQNGLNSLNINGSASIGAGQIAQLRVFTMDGGTHSLNINRAYLIIERII
jgi:hypothetical protein